MNTRGEAPPRPRSARVAASRVIAIVVVAVALAAGAGPAAAQGAASAGGATALEWYDLGQAAWRQELPPELAEVSGLAFTPDWRLFAHGDEAATIWQLDRRRGAPVKR